MFPLIPPFPSSERDNSAQPLLIIMPDVHDATDYRTRWPKHEFVEHLNLESAIVWSEPPTDPDAIVYLLLTSGSMGLPKGAMVATAMSQPSWNPCSNVTKLPGATASPQCST